jgi:hypothetical protein
MIKSLLQNHFNKDKYYRLFIETEIEYDHTSVGETDTATRMTWSNEFDAHALLSEADLDMIFI